MTGYARKHGATLKRLLSVLCLLALLLAGLPAAAEEAVYGRVNFDEVRLRRKAESTEVWAMLNTGWVCEIRGEKRSGGTDYYYVRTNIPKHLDREYYGYVSKQYLTVMTDEEVAVWEDNGGNAYFTEEGVPATVAPAAPEATQDTGPAGDLPVEVTDYARPNNASTNYYSYNGSTFSSLGLLSAEEAYYVTGRQTVDGTDYYIILVNNVNCYVRASSMTLLDSSGGSVPTSQVTATAGPTATPLPGGAPAGAQGRIRIKLAGNTNFRRTPAMLTSNLIRKMPQGTELYYYADADAGTKWYYCYDSVSGEMGYILGTCAEVIETLATVAPGVVPTGNTSPVTAPPGGGSTSVLGYIRIRPAGKTHVREKPQVNKNNVAADAQQGEILPYYTVSLVNGTKWYYVYYAPKGVFGYVLGTCATEVSDPGGQPAAPTSPVTTTAAPDGTTAIGYVITTAGGVNFRDGVGVNQKKLGSFDKDTVLPYYDTRMLDGIVWYYVRWDEQYGFIQGKFCKPCDAYGRDLDASGNPLPTDEYLMTTADKVYVRSSTSTTSRALGQIKSAGTVLKIAGSSVIANSVTWYRVEYEGVTGYMHGKFVTVLTPSQVQAYLNGQPLPTADPTATPKPKPTNYIRTIKDNVWIRKSPSQQAGTQGQAKLGAVFQFDGTTTVGKTLWYRITYNNATCYLMGSCCEVMTDAEYNAYLGSQPTPRVTATPRPEDWSTTALTNMVKVIVRAEPNGKQLGLLYRENTVCTLLGPTSVAGGYTWYNVQTSGMTGWIRGDLLRILTKAQAEVFQKTGDPLARPEASYVTLQMGSRGDAVTKLQTRLCDLGYLSESAIDGVYGEATRDAVRRYQEDFNLTIDGIANSATQHSLFGTVETGYYDLQNGSSTAVVLHKPELIDWYTGGIQDIWKKGGTAIITDVRTGISFVAKRWSGGYHADVEPLTAADTAAMCKIYGVSKAQDISDKNMWQRRPLLVTINGHSYAASMYGIPHNYPEGDTIADNDFNGQFCVHFVNSRVHASGKVDKDHQDAIMYAYNNAARLLGITE